LVASALVATPSGATPGTPATTCLGKPVTVVASSSVVTGTEGDDVVAMTPSGWSKFDALGGNDTICLALGIATGGRDPMPPTGWLDAGAGDDVVVDESTFTPDAVMYVGLGTGDDAFTGNDVAERVYTDSSPFPLDDSVPAGANTDVVDTRGGPDEVWTAAPADGLNADRITLGAGTARVNYRGAMSPQGSLDVGAASATLLELPQPGAAEPLARGELVVDNVARRASVGDAVVLTWTGQIDSFRFGRDAASSSGLPVSFTGSDADEYVTVAGGPIGDVNLGGGDDALKVEAYNDAFTPRSADGGPGSDWAAIDTGCLVLAIRLDDSTSCDGATGPFTGFDEVIGSSERGGSRVTVVGTDAGERLVANGDRVRVRGRGGADRILVDEGWTVRVSGGGGADRILASGDDVVVRGQAGGDRVSLSGSPGYHLFHAAEVKTKQQVALGGAGRDVLVGTSQGRGDRLLGGGGRDTAVGRAGRWDYCVAETTRGCERP
jgi:hypothetical protein